jgi:hypothetical protein
MMFLGQPDPVEKMVTASGGYDLPAFANLTTLKVWAEEGPPKGTLYHYPNPHNHQTLSIAAAPAPHKIAEQIYTQAIQTQMIVPPLQGRGDGQDARLGRQGNRRLLAQLGARLRNARRDAVARRRPSERTASGNPAGSIQWQTSPPQVRSAPWATAAAACTSSCSASRPLRS